MLPKYTKMFQLISLKPQLITSLINNSLWVVRARPIVTWACLGLSIRTYAFFKSAQHVTCAFNVSLVLFEPSSVFAFSKCPTWQTLIHSHSVSAMRPGLPKSDRRARTDRWTKTRFSFSIPYAQNSVKNCVFYCQKLFSLHIPRHFLAFDVFLKGEEFSARLSKSVVRLGLHPRNWRSAFIWEWRYMRTVAPPRTCNTNGFQNLEKRSS